MVIINNINDITISQIEDMKHAIGFSKSRVTGIKHRVMHCFRNYFCDYPSNKNWEDLVNKELAIKSIPNENGIVCFYLTDKGFKFLADLCGFKKMYEID